MRKNVKEININVNSVNIISMSVIAVGTQERT